MPRAKKYTYLWVVQGNYGHGWEDLTASEDFREAKDDARAYRTNAPEPIRVIRRRELNEQPGD